MFNRYLLLNVTLLIVSAWLLGGCLQTSPMTASHRRSVSLELPETDSREQQERFQSGKALYTQHCAGCHGSLELSAKRNKTEAQILGALQAIPNMEHLKNQNLDTAAIALALSDSNNSNQVPGGITPPTHPPGTKISSIYSCSDNNSRGLATFTSRRLTQAELKNALSKAFGKEAMQEISGYVELYPKQEIVESIEEFDSQISQQRLLALVEISSALQDNLLSSVEKRAKFLPDSVINQYGNIDLSNRSANLELLRVLEQKLFRRPMSKEQETLFLGVLESDEDFHQYNQHRIGAVIGAMLLSPNFNTLLAYMESSSGHRGRLDSYSVAERMSFQLTTLPPDSALYEAAKRGELNTFNQRQAHASRMIQQPEARQHILDVFSNVVDLDRDLTLNTDYANHTGINSNNLVNDLRQEARSFLEHELFVNNSNFQTLMTSKRAFPPSANSAKVFGTSSSSGFNDPRYTAKGHIGLFMRPVYMLGSTNRTSPIVRGVKITRNVLCTDIPDPDPELVAQAEEIHADIDHFTTTAREQAHLLTEGPVCQSCHQHINPPGFFYEGYGPFGDKRNTETVFNTDGSYKSELPIDTAVSGFPLDGVQDQSFSGAEEFVTYLADSPQAQGCFSRNLFEKSQFIPESRETHCHLAEMESAMKSGQSLLDVLIINAISEDVLWVKNQ